MSRIIMMEVRIPRGRCVLLAIALLAAVLLVTAGPVLPQIPECNSAGVTVGATGPISGLWTYSVSGCGIPPSGTYLLMLGDCESNCQPEQFTFPSPAGTTIGRHAYGYGCYVCYGGEYLCVGDPSIPSPLLKPAIKLEYLPPVYPWDCGQYCLFQTPTCGSWSFKTVIPPGPNIVHVDALLIKDYLGQYCTSDISGPLPYCDYVNPTEGTSWGFVKSLYR